MSHPAIRALTCLLELAAGESGYLVRGVRGWATAPDVEKALDTWGTSELMRAQARRGRVIQADVRAPGDAKPVWVYHISQRGIDGLAEAVGTAPAGISDPHTDPGTAIYMRDGVAVALSALRSVADTPAKREKVWVPGQTGWRTSQELARRIEKEDEEAGRSPGRSFLSEDLAWLVRLGYAEQKVVAKAHIDRLTPTGAAVQRLEWKELDA